MIRLDSDRRLLALLLVLSCCAHLVLLKLPIRPAVSGQNPGVTTVSLCRLAAASSVSPSAVAMPGAESPDALKPTSVRTEPLAARSVKPAQASPSVTATQPAKVQTEGSDQARGPAGAGGASRQTGSAAGADASPSAGVSDGQLPQLNFGSAGGPGFKRQVLPVYPRQARVMHTQGCVVLRLAIDSAGRLQAVEVVEAAPNGLTEAAVRAVRRSTYYPALSGGHPVASTALLPVRFSLAGAP